MVTFDRKGNKSKFYLLFKILLVPNVPINYNVQPHTKKEAKFVRNSDGSNKEYADGSSGTNEFDFNVVINCVDFKQIDRAIG